MSARDEAIELLNKWKSDGTRIMVVFIGTSNFVTFTLQGTVSDPDPVGASVVITGDNGTATFSVASARMSSGSPKGDGNPSMALFCDGLRAKKVNVVEFFFAFGDALLFSVLDAIDVPLPIM